MEVSWRGVRVVVEVSCPCIHSWSLLISVFCDFDDVFRVWQEVTFMGGIELTMSSFQAGPISFMNGAKSLLPGFP